MSLRPTNLHGLRVSGVFLCLFLFTSCAAVLPILHAIGVAAKDVSSSEGEKLLDSGGNTLLLWLLAGGGTLGIGAGGIAAHKKRKRNKIAARHKHIL